MKQRPKSDTQLAEALRAWGRTHHLMLAVKDARDGCGCEVAYIGDFSDGYAGEPACWRSLDWDRSTYEPINPGNWCEACLQRQQFQAALSAVKRKLSARLRTLQRLSRAPKTTPEEA